MEVYASSRLAVDSSMTTDQIIAARPDAPPPEWLKGLWDFTSQDPEDLQFNAYEVIRVESHTVPGNGWWTGRTKNSKSGTFPINYTTPHFPTPEEITSFGGAPPTPLRAPTKPVPLPKPSGQPRSSSLSSILPEEATPVVPARPAVFASAPSPVAPETPPIPTRPAVARPITVQVQKTATPQKLSFSKPRAAPRGGPGGRGGPGRGVPNRGRGIVRPGMASGVPAGAGGGGASGSTLISLTKAQENQRRQSIGDLSSLQQEDYAEEDQDYETEDEPQVLFQATVIADFNAETMEEISLEIGAVVSVLKQDDDGWWTVRDDTSKVSGLFPGGYLRRV